MQAALASQLCVGLPAQRRCGAPCKRRVVFVRAQQRTAPQVQAEDVVKATALASLAGAFLGTGSVQAAMEVGQLAAGDGRTGTLFSLAIPVLAWAGYNIWGPASRQLENMNAKQAIAGAVGLGTAVSLLLAPEADAATEAMQLAAGDGRFGILTTIVLIALGWVTFQILGPAQRQLENMNAKTGKGKRAVAGAIGLGAASSLLLAPNADAAEIMQLAANDGRFGILTTIVLIALGWVGFQILGPAQRQLENMNAKTGKGKRAVAGAIGLGAASSLLLVPGADAAEIMQVAANDGRFGILTTIVLIALGWVTFQILGPAQRQLENMNAKTGKGKRAVAGAIGLGAASSLLLAPNADAAEIMQLAANDGRFGILTTIVLIALGWVGFQILGPAQRQLENMNAKTGKTTSKRK